MSVCRTHASVRRPYACDDWEKETVSLDVSAAAAGESRRRNSPTRTGRPRASRAPPWRSSGSRRLWINTGTLCNITCRNCYIESSPSNDRLVYITAAEAAAYFDEIEAGGLGTREIGFTGGEPFMNPHLLAMVEDALQRGFEVLVLTNAMQPMQRPKVKRGLLDLNAALRRAPDAPRQPRPLHAEPCTRPSAARAPGRARIAGLDWLAAERLQDRHRRAHLLERGRGGDARRLRPPHRRARLAGRCRRSGASWCCCRRWTASTTCRRSPRAAGPS